MPLPSMHPFPRALAPVLVALWGIAGAAEGRDHGWPVYHGDPEGTHHSPLRRIHRGNVHRLQPAWVFRDDAPVRAGGTIECNPLVRNRVLYGTTPGLRLFALDAETGRLKWTFDPWSGGNGAGVNRGLAWWEEASERRLFFSAGTRLFAIDPDTGRPIAGFGTEGSVDLRDGLDQEGLPLTVTLPTPGIVYRDLLILGSSIPDTLPPTAPGHIRALDVRTGQRRWIFHTLPRPGDPAAGTWEGTGWRDNGGANAWGGLTLDPARGLVFCGTGSANYDHYGGDRPGANLYANCVLALDATTGALQWHFQVVHHDIWDYDLPCPPVLIQVRRQGRTVPAAAQITKTGHVFVFDRVTGHPLFPVEERAVPPSDVPGESAWPTQPFPLRPPPFARQGFSEAEVTDLHPRARAAVLERLKGMRAGGLYTPPSTNPTVVMPQFNGGGEWGGAAWDPKRRLLIVNASNEPEWIQMQPARVDGKTTAYAFGSQLQRALCSQCHGAGRPDLPPNPALQSWREVRTRLTRQQVANVLITGKGQMPSFATLTQRQREALVAFIFDDRDGPTIQLEEADLAWANRIPWVANGHPELRDPDGYPASRRPWGTLTALDLDEGRIRWQVPLGTYPALERLGYPPTGTFNIGGPMVTAGGLVFLGATMDERFRAFDVETGRVLWEYQLDAGGYAAPATYEIAGRQYVVIAAGGGGKPGTRSGNTWWCFSLPGAPPGRSGPRPSQRSRPCTRPRHRKLARHQDSTSECLDVECG